MAGHDPIRRDLAAAKEPRDHGLGHDARADGGDGAVGQRHRLGSIATRRRPRPVRPGDLEAGLRRRAAEEEEARTSSHARASIEAGRGERPLQLVGCVVDLRDPEGRRRRAARRTSRSPGPRRCRRARGRVAPRVDEGERAARLQPARARAQELGQARPRHVAQPEAAEERHRPGGPARPTRRARGGGPAGRARPAGGAPGRASRGRRRSTTARPSPASSGDHQPVPAASSTISPANGSAVQPERGGVELHRPGQVVDGAVRVGAATQVPVVVGRGPGAVVGAHRVGIRIAVRRWPPAPGCATIGGEERRHRPAPAPPPPARPAPCAGASAGSHRRRPRRRSRGTAAPSPRGRPARASPRRARTTGS